MVQEYTSGDAGSVDLTRSIEFQGRYRPNEPRLSIVPALPPISKVIQFKLFTNDNGNTNVQNVLYFSYSGSLAATDLQTLCNNMVSAWVTNMLPKLVNTNHILGVTGNDLSSVTAPKSASTGVVSAGTVTPPAITSGAAFVIGHDTSRKYKGGHSRTYITGLPTSDLADGNTWSAAAQTAILTAWNAFITAFTQTLVPAAVGALTQVVAHRYGRTAGSPVLALGSKSPSVPLTTPFADPVTASIANPQVGSQRRRNQQVG